MSEKLRNPKILAGVALGVVAVIAAGAWIVLVGPERSKVGKLDGQITAVQTQITQRKAALATPKANVHLRAERHLSPDEGNARRRRHVRHHRRAQRSGR